MVLRILSIIILLYASLIVVIAVNNFLIYKYMNNIGESVDEPIDTEMFGGAPSGKSKSIFDHMFSFDGQYKADILNVAQYSFISLIPLVLLTKLIQYVIPDASTNGSSIEISIEIIGQISILIIGLVLVNRFVTYFNTYSGDPYPKQSVVHFVLGFLTILISIQSKLGEKINILADRFMDKVNGPKPPALHPRPGRQHHIPDVQVMGRHPQPGPQDTTQISNLPVIEHSLNAPPQRQVTHQYDNSTQYSTNYEPGLKDAQMMQQMSIDEPSAANGVLGGSFGSAW